MNKYKDYPSYEEFIEHEFFPVRCAGANYYWVSFKDGPSFTLASSGSACWPYYSNDMILPGGGGFDKPENLNWPTLTKFQYDQTHPILCYNENYNQWAWFSHYHPLFDDLGYLEPKKLIFRLVGEEDSSEDWVGLVKGYWEQTGWDLSPLYDYKLYNLDNFTDLLEDKESKLHPLEELPTTKVYENKYITRVVLDVWFDPSDVEKPYGHQGSYDCGTVFDIIKALKAQGYDADLRACVTNAATIPEFGVSEYALHPELRKSKGEIDG